jgi:peptide/nickel transport system permease protein
VTATGSELVDGGAEMLGRYIARRTARVIPILILVSIVTFMLLHIAPGGPVGIMTGNPKVTGADIERIRQNYGLDKPLPLQYLLWFRQVFFRFDFGRSYVTGEPVSRMILERMPATFELMAISFAGALLLGIFIGVVSALRQGRFADDVFSFVSAIGLSVPAFWLGLMAIGLFSLKFGLLPSGGREAFPGPGTAVDHLRHLVLPVSVLSLTYLASWSRYMRAGMIDAIRGDFVRTARSKGLNERVVIFKHVLRNAILPVITIVFMQIPTLFTGAVITETVFSWPGMGRLFYEGLQRHDYSRVLGIVVVASLLIILFNLIGDLICMVADPRYAPWKGERIIAGDFGYGGAVKGV